MPLFYVCGEMGKKCAAGKAQNCTEWGAGGENIRRGSSLTGTAAARERGVCCGWGARRPWLGCRFAAAGFHYAGFFGDKIVTVVLGAGDDARKTRLFENVGKFGQGFLIFFAVFGEPVDDFVERLA